MVTHAPLPTVKKRACGSKGRAIPLRGSPGPDGSGINGRAVGPGESGMTGRAARQGGMGIEEVAIRAQEQERERIALELHDGVAQTLTSALRYLQTLEAMAPQELAESRRTVGRTRYLVRHALQEVREVIYSLHPAALSRLGLVATLRQELGRLREETGWQVDFAAGGMPFSKGEGR